MNKPLHDGYFIVAKISKQSVAWFPLNRLAEAERECKRMNYRGGEHYIIEPSYKTEARYIEGL